MSSTHSGNNNRESEKIMALISKLKNLPEIAHKIWKCFSNKLSPVIPILNTI